ncbi:aldehyde dehydrogenase family protein [Cobetia marina]
MSATSMHKLDQQFINNAWVKSHGERRLAVTNPFEETVIAEVTAGDARDVEAAVTAAANAFEGWQALSGAERAVYLEAFAEGLTSRREALVEMSCRNNGKIRAEAEIDLDDAIGCYRYYAEQARALDARQGAVVAHDVEGYAAHSYQEPAGVVGLITPWNFPLVTSAWKVAPALAAGCTLVIKPSEVTPLPEQVMAEIALEAGLPAGVFNLLHGDGEGIGAPLTRHPRIDKISFTGSNGVGEKVMQAAACGTRGVSLELGGKSAIIVLEDADIDDAADWVMAGIYFNAGQICSATSRLLVHEAIADDLHTALASRIDALVLGDPLDADTQMGPMTSARQRDTVLGYLNVAREEGLTALRDDTHRSLPTKGYFVAPTLYTDVPVESRLWREEIFGPVLCSRRVADEAEAIRLANDSDFGLVATVVSGDARRAQQVGRRLRAGVVWYNSEQLPLVQASWGGFKRSGIGRELGPWGLAGYLEVKHIIGPVLD